MYIAAPAVAVKYKLTYCLYIFKVYVVFVLALKSDDKQVF